MSKLFFKITLVSLMLIVSLSFAFADQKTTSMTWVVPSAKSHSIAYGSGCSQVAFFFVESDANIDNDIDGNALKILPTNARNGGTGCQTSATAGMTITNSGNITTNIDANFSGNLDANVWLKVWMGTDSGCGTNGLGGWQRLCTFYAANDATSAVDPSNCRDFNSDNETLGARLITSLTALDNNQLCFSGELAGSLLNTQANVAQGDHNGTFQTSTDFS